MKSLFLTFGDGSAEFRAAALRLAGQAKSIGVFSSVVSLNHESLLQVSSEYALAQSSIINLDSYPRLFRAAKAWVVQAGLMGKFGEFDLVCYADAGCEIISNQITRFVLRKNIQRAFYYGGMAEQTLHAERNWTKKRTLGYFECSMAHSLSGQIASTLSYWRVNSQSIEISNKWCMLSDYKLDLWQDPKNRDEEEDYFMAHRHDQSIFSLLWKQAELPVTPLYEQFNNRLGGIRIACIPINVIRNRTGTSKIPKASKSIFVAFLGLILNLLGRYKPDRHFLTNLHLTKRR